MLSSETLIGNLREDGMTKRTLLQMVTLCILVWGVAACSGSNGESATSTPVLELRTTLTALRTAAATVTKEPQAQTLVASATPILPVLLDLGTQVYPEYVAEPTVTPPEPAWLFSEDPIMPENVEKMALVRSAKLPEDKEGGIHISPDGLRIAIAGFQGITILSTQSMEEIGFLETGFEVTGVAFSPDGQTLAAWTQGDNLFLWLVTDGTLPQVLAGHTDWLRDAAFSPDGSLLASGSDDRSVRLWRVQDGALLNTLEEDGTGASNVLFSPDGSILAAKHHDSVFLWDPADGRLLRKLEGHEGGIISLDFSPDGTLLATSSQDDTVKVWRVSDGELLRTFAKLIHYNSSLWFSPDGELLAHESDAESTISVWQVEDGSLRYQLPDVLSARFSPDGQILATGSWDSTLRLWQASDGSLLNTLDGPPGVMLVMGFSPNGQRLYTSGYLFEVLQWGVMK